MIENHKAEKHLDWSENERKDDENKVTDGWQEARINGS